MPWDSIDRWRDEDATERRKGSRRRPNHLSGRRSIDQGRERAEWPWWLRYAMRGAARIHYPRS